jgi:hypothetical protein
LDRYEEVYFGSKRNPWGWKQEKPSGWTQEEKMASLVDSITLAKNGSWTLLHGFAATGNEIAVQWLLEDDKSNLVRAMDKRGHTPLHVAAMHGHDVVVQTLLQYGARVETHDQLGQTPLHLAAFGRSKRCAQLLLANGADPHARDDWYHTPATLCYDDKELYTLMTEEKYQRYPQSKALKVPRPNVMPKIPSHLRTVGTKRNAGRVVAKEVLGVLKELI